MGKRSDPARPVPALRRQLSVDSVIGPDHETFVLRLAIPTLVIPKHLARSSVAGLSYALSRSCQTL
jgi:hypothetical protein